MQNRVILLERKRVIQRETSYPMEKRVINVKTCYSTQKRVIQCKMLSKVKKVEEMLIKFKKCYLTRNRNG